MSGDLLLEMQQGTTHAHICYIYRLFSVHSQSMLVVHLQPLVRALLSLFLL